MAESFPVDCVQRNGATCHHFRPWSFASPSSEARFGVKSDQRETDCWHTWKPVFAGMLLDCMEYQLVQAKWLGKMVAARYCWSFD